MMIDGKRLGLEIKRADAPRLSPSMRHALADLRLDALWVLCAHAYPLHESVLAMPVEKFSPVRCPPCEGGEKSTPAGRHGLAKE